MQELRRDQRQAAEVALEHVDGGLDGLRVGVAIGGDGAIAAGSGGALGVHQIGELALQGRTDHGFVGLELTGLLIAAGHEVLHVVLRQVVDREAGTDDGGRRGDEVFVDRTDGLSRVGLPRGAHDAVLGLSVRGGGGQRGLDPSGEAAGAVGNRAVVDRRQDIRGEGQLHGALHVEGGLGELTGQLVLDARDVQDVLREVRHVDGPAEHVDVVLHFRAVALRVLLEVRVGARAGGIDVSAVKDAKFDGGIRIAIDLPAERRVTRLGPALRHRGDGRVLLVDVEDEVAQLLADTDASAGEGALVLKLPFVEVGHVCVGLEELAFEHVGQVVD